MLALAPLGFPAQGEAWVRAGRPSLAGQVADLRDRIEPAFHAAGVRLSRTAEVLGQTKGPLHELSDLGEGRQLDQLRDFAAKHHQDQSRLASELSAAIEAIDMLEAGTAEVHEEIAQIEKTVLTMKFVVINARISIAAISEAGSSLEFFTNGATEVVDQTIGLLQTLDRTMRRFKAGARDARGRSAQLAARITQNAQRASSKLYADIDRFQVHLRSLSRSGSEIAEQTGMLMSATACAVGALQIGDTTKQRLDHIVAILERAEGPGDPGPLLSLGIAQLLDTAEHHAAGVETLKNNAQDLERGVLDFSRQYLLPFVSSAGGQSPAADLTGDLELIDASVRDALSVYEALQDHTRRLESYPVELRELISKGDGFAESIRMIGLNAVLICARLGQDGVALKHISLQMQDLAAESARRLQRIRAGLTGIAGRAADISAQLSRTAEIATSTFQVPATELCDKIRAIEALVTHTQALVVQAQDGFNRDRIDFGPLETQCERMEAFARSQDAPPVAAADHEADPDFLREIWRSYTMEQERHVHRAVFSGAPDPEEPEDGTLSEGQDTDDIFF